MALATLPCHLLAFVVLGGFTASGGVILWGLGFPVAIGVLLWGYRTTLYWFAAYVVNVVIAVSLEPSLTPTSNVPDAVNSLILAINILLMSAVMVAIFGYFISQRDLAFRLLHGEQVKSENLLLNILPSEIAAILKNENRTIADYYEGASILFADVVNFTPLSASMTPVELVNLLNEVFSHFDTLVESYGLEKIKTIGDCYMVASGVPRPRVDHAQALVRMALDMQKYVNEHRFGDRQLRFRMGINSGAVVAGVIGRKKFIYDLWGDAVNTASRMESHGDSGSIQITRATYELIQDDFACEAKGTIQVKGKGEMETWHVVREK
jgi:adenylate cyclase